MCIRDRLWYVYQISISICRIPSLTYSVPVSYTHLHAHTTNVIALTFVLPLEDKVCTRELWEMATECPVVFPSGIGVGPWMVPGGREIAVATSELMKKYDLAIWAHHGMFADVYKRQEQDRSEISWHRQQKEWEQRK